jgi:hypothetical protein
LFNGITDTYNKEARCSKSSISNVYEYLPEGIYVWKINTHARVLQSHMHVLFSNVLERLLFLTGGSVMRGIYKDLA